MMSSTNRLVRTYKSAFGDAFHQPFWTKAPCTVLCHFISLFRNTTLETNWVVYPALLYSELGPKHSSPLNTTALTTAPFHGDDAFVGLASNGNVV